MQQVLFHIPIPFTDREWPIFGYGVMLFVAFLACIVVATWRAHKAGIPKECVYDLIPWVFVFGLIGARINFMVQYHVPAAEFYEIWNGGLVFYGSAIGGLVGYGLAYVFVLRKKYQLSTWKMADVAAPCIALGLCLGRLGCFLNGCCYGNVACSDCPSCHFPLSSPARYELVGKGYQTAAGFIPQEGAPLTVDRVERGSPAYEKGLRDGDTILKVDGHELADNYALAAYLSALEWPKGKTDLQLTVRHKDETEAELAAFYPHTLGLHPTQLYESVSMLLLMLLLFAYYPFRRRDGELAVILMLCYAVHRFLNEILRNDTDPVFLDMTWSQNLSILIFLGGLILGWWLWRKPVQYVRGGKPQEAALPAAVGATR